MLHLDSARIRESLFHGKFGLEKEGLRVLSDGSMAHTPHPFADSIHITRDFSENQTEIITSAEPAAEGAVLALEAYHRQVVRTLSGLPEREFLWPFSNPPFLSGEEDIPIARFKGSLAYKTEYREYLAERYGRYKMTFSGIHINYSFSEELLKSEFALREGGRSRSFHDSFYLELAEKVSAYAWLPVILTAASPVLDGSFFEKGRRGEDIFTGMGSVRCSELGYWNSFVPVFDYTNIQKYADGIQQYVDVGLLCSAQELYYPVRLKPKGENSLSALKEDGIDHIELRMIDLNPLTECGLDVRDVQFMQLFLIWLAAMPRRRMSLGDQVTAVRNVKNAARYDLRTVRIAMPELTGEAAESAEGAALRVLRQMKDFYDRLGGDAPVWMRDVLDFEEQKVKNPRYRYAVRVRSLFSDSFAEKGLMYTIRGAGGDLRDSGSCDPGPRPGLC